MNTVDQYAGERLKRTHFYPRAKALNIRDAWLAWNGYKFAECYYDAEYEYFCIRNSCATYDICPMQKYYVEGADAETSGATMKGVWLTTAPSSGWRKTSSWWSLAVPVMPG